MKVQAFAKVPLSTEIEVRITCTLQELEALSRQLDSGKVWSKTGELLVAAIRTAATNVKNVAEQVVEEVP